MSETEIDELRREIRLAIDDVNRELREKGIGGFVGPWDGRIEVVKEAP